MSREYVKLSELTQEEIADHYKQNVKKYNQNAKKSWDIVTVALPKGTKARIKTQGETINNFIKNIVLEKLDMLENQKT